MIRSEIDKSERKSGRLMELMRRKVRVAGWGAGGRGILKTVRSAKWSDGVSGRQQTDTGELQIGVMRRSRVLPLSCVGKFTWLARLKSASKERNWEVCRSDGLLQGMLKSPVMAKLEQVVVRERKDENSSRKVEKGRVCSELGGL